MHRTNILKISIPLIIILLTFGIFRLSSKKSQQSPIATNKVQFTKPRVWQVKSIDTMKYSRDKAKEQLNNQKFDQTIEIQISAIKNSGANYVAIDTPYDEEFYPFLKRWVDISRNHGLNIWFRGNFSGWEGWFGYPKNLSRSEHINLTIEFIKKHAELFHDGDILTPCTECENGGPGDPRNSGDATGFRSFMINEYEATKEEFNKINKKVSSNYNSMNYDVANLVFDDATTRSMDNLIVVDHHIDNPEKISEDINKLHEKTGAKIVLGEISISINKFSAENKWQEQAKLLEKSLRPLTLRKELIGLNYWVGFGDKNAIFNDDGSAKPAAEILEKYYNLPVLPDI